MVEPPDLQHRLARANALAGAGLFAWDELLIVLVGDGALVHSQLAEAGFPAPTLVDENGQLLQQ